MIDYENAWLEGGINSVDIVDFDVVANAISLDTASLSLLVPPAFPIKILINDCQIELNADGSHTGDAESFIEAFEKCEGPDLLMWCVINILKQQIC